MKKPFNINTEERWKVGRKESSAPSLSTFSIPLVQRPERSETTAA